MDTEDINENSISVEIMLHFCATRMRHHALSGIKGQGHKLAILTKGAEIVYNKKLRSNC